VSILDQLLYGPNVALALLGAAGAMTMFLALFALTPSVDVKRKILGEEKRKTTLQQVIDQANLPITAGEFLRVGTILAVVTAIAGFVSLRAITGVMLGMTIGPLLLWAYLVEKRDRTRRTYQEALARTATIFRDTLGEGRSIRDAFAAIAERGPTVVRGDFEDAGKDMVSGQELEDVMETMGRKRRDPVLAMLGEILLVNREHGAWAKSVLDRLSATTRRRANVRKRVLAEQAQLRWTARIVSVAPFVMLATFRFSAPGLVAPYYATTAGEITILIAGLISIVSYLGVMRIGNRPLKIVESVFLEPEPGTTPAPPPRRAQPAATATAAEGRSA
jgi:Flp pilus assembly protein TadB